MKMRVVVYSILKSNVCLELSYFWRSELFKFVKKIRSTRTLFCTFPFVISPLFFLFDLVWASLFVLSHWFIWFAILIFSFVLIFSFSFVLSSSLFLVWSFCSSFQFRFSVVVLPCSFFLGTLSCFVRLFFLVRVFC